jgi:hypothetical protein
VGYEYGLHSNSRTTLLAGNDSTSLAALGSVQLEFAELSRLLGEPAFERAADRAVDQLFQTMHSYYGLYPSRIRPSSASFAPAGHVGFGGDSDSFYEILLKRWLHSGGKRPRLLRMFRKATTVGLRRVLRHSHPRNMVFVGSLDASYEWDEGRSEEDDDGFSPRSSMARSFEHLGCFLPGLLALGARHSIDSGEETTAWTHARSLLSTCTHLYEEHAANLGPERVVFNTDLASANTTGVLRDFLVTDPSWRGRPEYVESLYLMSRLDPDIGAREQYRRQGWAVFEALRKHCRISWGYVAHVRNVVREPIELVSELDSYFFAETLKYLFLLFSEPSKLDLTSHVLTTEGHVLPLPPLPSDAAKRAYRRVRR